MSSGSDYWNCKSSYDYLLNGIDTVAFLVLGLALFGLHKIFRLAMGETRAVIGLVAAAGFEGVEALENITGSLMSRAGEAVLEGVEA